MPRKAAPTAPYTLMTLACSALQVDTGIQPRLALDSQVVTKYATLYEEDEEGQTTLPPLDVFQVEGAYYVADGFHRLAAALQASRDTVPCQVYTGTRRDAMVHAVFANVRRGLDYSYGDKQQILERLLADPEIAARGDRSLAQDLGVSHMTVWRTRVSPGGRSPLAGRDCRHTSHREGAQGPGAGTACRVPGRRRRRRQA